MMLGGMSAQQQLWLLGGGQPSFDRRFTTARRIDLGHGAWIEHVRGWVSGHDALFTALHGAMSWRAEQRVMYERVVDVPRLLADVPQDGTGHPLLPEMAEALGARHGAHFDALTLALYRDGHDSVAWHRDRCHRDRERCVVVVTSLGGARRFMVRPLSPVGRPAPGGASITVTVAGGDVLVMGGTCQRTVEHCVPKTKRADPRIAIMFRHTEPIAPRVT